MFYCFHIRPLLSLLLGTRIQWPVVYFNSSIFYIPNLFTKLFECPGGLIESKLILSNDYNNFESTIISAGTQGHHQRSTLFIKLAARGTSVPHSNTLCDTDFMTSVCCVEICICMHNI